VKSCTARGPAVELVLDRGRENRSQLVFTRLKGGREAIFWQTPKTNRKARPSVRTPTARASGAQTLEIVIDSSERYPYRFASQQATAVRGSLPAVTTAYAVTARCSPSWSASRSRTSRAVTSTAGSPARCRSSLRRRGPRWWWRSATRSCSRFRS
jgi:hypothetical protein